MTIRVTVVMQKEEDWYVARCIENNVASQGKSIGQALDNLREALELYYEGDPPQLENRYTMVNVY